MRVATKKAIKIALAELGKPDSSIRKACKAAGITPATLYNNTSHAQLENARKASPAPKQRRRVQPNQSAPIIPSSVDVNITPEYVAKLERFALKRLLDEQE